MVPPSTTHPPGKRTNPGFNSASICARSGRSPFGRPLKVFAGNSDTMSNQIEGTAPPNARMFRGVRPSSGAASRVRGGSLDFGEASCVSELAAPEDGRTPPSRYVEALGVALIFPTAKTNLALGWLFVAVNVAWNWFQCLPMPLISAGWLHSDPSASSNVAVRGPENPSAARAQKDRLYCSPCWTPMPQKPSLAMPRRPDETSATSSRNERGVASLSGSVMSI